MTGRTGGRRKADVLNIRNLLWTKDALKDLVQVDTFTGWKMLQRSVPRPQVPGMKLEKMTEPRPWRDEDTTALMEFLTEEGLDKVSAALTDRAIDLYAWDRRYSSAVERLDALPDWDGVERMHRFFIDVCAIEPTSMAQEKYLEAVARSFFLSVVARVLKPGCKQDTMFILEGKQGIGKSRLWRLLALDDRWFSDGMPLDVGSKDAKQHLPGKLIIEMAELGQMKKSAVDSLKMFLSASDDKFRPSYGRNEVQNLRQCVFVGSTNENEYLQDDTGNRRFLPMKCGDVIDFEMAGRLVALCYAEALARFHEGWKWWIDDKAVLAAVEAEQNERMEGDVWLASIAHQVEVARVAAVAGGQKEFIITVQDILIALFNDNGESGGHQIARWTNGDGKRVGIALRKLGGVKLPPPGRGDRRRSWKFRA